MSSPSPLPERIKVANVILIVALVLALVGSFLGFWFGNPSVVQNASPVSATSDPKLKDIQKSLQEYNQSAGVNVKLCDQCSMNGGAFLGMVMIAPLVVLAGYGIYRAVEYKKTGGSISALHDSLISQ